MPLTTYKGLEPKTIDKIYQVTFRNGIMYWSNMHHTLEDAERDVAEKLKYGYTNVEIRAYEAKLTEVFYKSSSAIGKEPTPQRPAEEDDLDLYDRHLHNCAASERNCR